MRPLLVCLWLTTAMLAGCGQKGPLFLPPETPPAQAGTP
ncbi:MAG TPA: lipoprotein [Pseudomonadales bacterium]|nr:lipoprotein [Pseudomonadales bacterium]HNC68928.1 lipoprotein [Pseudomonadales bacterium]HND14329.1 lipoprotein [Pseudomonadales bacterium]